MRHSPFNTLSRFSPPGQPDALYYSLPVLAAAGIGNVDRLPVSLRVVLEALLRHCDGLRVSEKHIVDLAQWRPRAERSEEIPFVVARVVLQDFTGVPLLCDLAAMRHVAAGRGLDPRCIEPLVPVDLVVDHSLQVDHYGTPEALQQNMRREFERNGERYQFMKWGMQAFDTFRVVPPGVGIVHQVNLEYLFRGVRQQETADGRLCFPDTLVGTDSHTTMINAVGVVGWGVGGIEAEAAMLGQPVYFLTPDVVGVELDGRLREGVTATDLVLTVTELLRREKVVGTFVEYFGDGASTLSVTDRATLANMAPEYGATMGFFPVDEKTVEYMRSSGRSEEDCVLFEAYFRAQGLFGIPRAGQVDYSRRVYLDLSTIVPSLAGPKRPQDRIALPDMASRFNALLTAAESADGFGRPAASLLQRHPTGFPGVDLGHGDVLIAAITSCTNTSNPAVMIAAGLLARKAVAKGLRVRPHIKTSLAPGSRVVTDYLDRAGLLAPLAELGFALVGYGCTTCIGNAGDLDPAFNRTIAEQQLIAAAVLSGNRNFEARIHPGLRANYLASPPLVVAFAIAGRVNIDLENEPLGNDAHGQPVYLRDIWPSSDEIGAVLPLALDPQAFRRRYADVGADQDLWQSIPAPSGEVYDWPPSSYIARPPFFELPPQAAGDIRGARVLLLLGDSVTTDHISPAGSFGEATPAGEWLRAQGVERADFNSYGSRRGHHEVMMRGTFANVRIRNLMLPPDADGRRREGGHTLLDGQPTTVFAAAMSYLERGIPSIVVAGEEYGTGSSRDWAAKGTRLLGVRAVIARSYERIHRANLVGMGVLPLQFLGDDSAASLGLRGDERFDISGLAGGLSPMQTVALVITRGDGERHECPLLCRIDTPIEVSYYRAGGILPFVLGHLLGER
ncbi:aconitate hydratase AcnA [Accumulibacter sp.]|uniref:aconitate hydratase AcnA n=1 Tax=Accumulibacter sp. TaxID=2053492 RepID=UPI0025E58262|nr:aconitate hydratase AcnA [Accumulibacter sp.]MCM8611477.1 aconitate hydratase AcnA [Accumulibacter sp.]MCM8635111.1 aconitate hydratase AcnA [Accumulibacter sp.]MCM8641034.1 aconitate hydratase AcnA [Accumulibacter sp.]